MSNDINLTAKYPDLEVGTRDAIHVPVVVVTSAKSLTPGTKVCLVEGSQTEVFAGPDRLIGIVNPFSQFSTYPGIPFFVCLFPGTISSLRHSWSHPYFEFPSVSESKEYIEQIAKRCGTSYDELMEAADTLVRSGDHTYDNTETYKDVSDGEWKLFWKHYSNVIGENVDEDYAPYTCSC